jgi:hypothetical protein
MTQGILMRCEHCTGDRPSDLPARTPQEANVEVQVIAARPSPEPTRAPVGSPKAKGEEEIHRTPEADRR